MSKLLAALLFGPLAWGQSGVAAPAIASANGASGFGGGTASAPGSWMEIHGTNLAATTRPWNSSDFIGGIAPVSLDGVTVTIGGQSAFVAYVSPTQVNALLPSTAPTGPQPLVVTYNSTHSSPFTVTVRATEPSLWAPSQFNIGGTQYVGAVFPDFATFVLPQGAIPGVPSRPAGPGDQVILYGVGFGNTSPSVPAGEVVSEATQLLSPVQFSLGQTAVAPAFAGLAPNETGLYQFNLQIPSGLGFGAVPVALTAGGAPVSQTPSLWLAVTPALSLQVTGLSDLAGNAGVAVPGGMVLIQGSGFAQNASTASYPLPTSIGTITVSFDGRPAPIASASPQQLEVQVPWELLGRPGATLTVADSASGAQASQAVTLQTAAPAVETAAAPGIQIENSGGASPAPGSQGSPNRPVMPGEFLDIPAVGLGMEKDGPADGQPATSANPGNPLVGVMVSIGGTWAPVTSAALAPGSAGISIVRVQVPVNTPTGSAVPLVVVAFGVSSTAVPIAVGTSSTAALQLSPVDGTMVEAPLGSYVVTLSGATSSQVSWSALGMGAPTPEVVSQIWAGFFTVEATTATYGGPLNTSLPEYMLVVAALQSDPSIFATARVLVTGPTTDFQITPRNAVVGPNSTVTFQALDANSTPVQVQWSIGGQEGSNVFQPEVFAVDTNPVFVQALANGGGAVGQDQTQIYVVPSEPSIVSLDPPYPAPGDSVTINTSGLEVRSVTVNFSRIDGSITSVSATHGDNQVTVIVPPDAVEGPLTIQAQPVNSAIVSTAPYAAAISPKLRLRPTLTEISQGESTLINAAFLFDTRTRPLNWTTTAGTISPSGEFTAPAVAQGTTYARISACLTDRNVCGWTAVAIQPFRVTPVHPAMPAGGSLQLQAVAGGASMPVTWQALTANITVDANGVVKAGSGPLDGGEAQVQAASAGGATVVIDIAVTGSQGGVTSISHDWWNWTGATPFGPDYDQVVTIGSRAYVLCADWPTDSSVPGYQANWIDTWDITDPNNPVWLGATGVPIAGALSNLGGELLVTGGWNGFEGQSIGLLYQIANGMPSLANYLILNDDQTFPGGGTSGPILYYYTGTVVLQWNLGALTPPAQLNVPVPQQCAEDALDDSGAVDLAGNASRLYLVCGGPGAPWQLVIYDVTVSPAAILNATNVSPPADYASLQMLGDLVLVNTAVYSVADDIPQLLSQLPPGDVLSTDASTMRVLFLPGGGVSIADLANPANPVVSAATPALGYGLPSIALAPGNSFLAAANGELETYSVVSTSGTQFLSSFGGSGIDWDQKTRGNLVYLAESLSDFQGGTYDPEIFKIYDLTNPSSPQLAGSYTDTTQSADAVQLSGNYALLVCDNDFVVLNVSNAAAPTKVASLPVGGTAETLSGTRAIVGSFTNNAPTLTIIDVSSPTAPAVLATVPLPNPAYGLALNGNTLAIATGSTGLYLYDVTNPLSPVKLWQSTDGSAAWDAAWVGNLLYTASGQQGLIIRDATNPRAPVTLGSNPLLFYPSSHDPCCDDETPVAISIYVAANVAWLGTTDSYATVFGVDVRNSADPRVINFVSYGDALEDQAVASIGTVGNYLLVGGNYQSSSAVNVVSANPPGNTMLPAMPQTTPGDFSSPLQLAPGADSASAPAAQPRTFGKFLELKLHNVPREFRERELRALNKK